MKNRSKGALPVILCFVLFIGAFTILHLALPDSARSENENRMLARAPKFSFRALFSGSFTEDFEDYVTDQFPFRDKWLDLKSRAERAGGKTENNGVFFCREDTLISRFQTPSESALDSAQRAVDSLAENTGLPVYLDRKSVV